MYREHLRLNPQVSNGKSTARPKRQHYVPKVHLRHFVGAAPANMIWTFDLVQSRWRTSTIDNTAVQSNFYSVETPEGPNDGLETLLSRSRATLGSHTRCCWPISCRPGKP